MYSWAYDHQELIEDQLTRFIRASDFPCVGAKAAQAKGTLRVVACRWIDSAWDDVRMHDIARQWAADYRRDPGLFRSLAFVFEGPLDLSEEQFERALWDRLQSMTDKDEWRGIPRDQRVSDDPKDPHFSLSFGGEAFFVVGLHPNASRPARRFELPAMILNLHDQFEALRAEGRYEKLRHSILERDRKIAGSINPMLARHGEASEARQYSGRAVPAGWQCPFSGRRGAND
ncbi:guanitoxin biosynthesis heme-dependent pre-guanitoxin N-hydroxylase GntA [Sphingomonas xanthus]|uniref:YqcI/YcgG family protein n=1 Tax=Sphingomonas xanthus TaxID=2594473 RepID=A0A516ITW2_9SPHN|nr:guanitoxin biosynthesis heme-dependent pre-guanitoxin N-hydroxylase GntA [Sphingomonas xanthus]QDP20264.1 YqcI/YcgG family protein [Sphingomonas xanthus]